MNSGRTLHLAAQVIDGCDVDARPGALLVEGDRVLAAGSPEAIGRPAEAAIVDHGEAALIPALVNAHAHLDLTHIGVRPCAGSFPDWVNMVRRERAMSEDAIRDSVREGIALSRAGGVALVGDIAGVRSLVPAEVMRETGMCGVSFVEVFGIGRGKAPAIEFIEQFDATNPREAGGVTLGLQPHAPYSCEAPVYAAAAKTGRPLTTHLAETLEELRYVKDGDGPLADMLRAIGVWDDSIRPHGGHSVDMLVDAIGGMPILAAHLNYVTDAALDRLSRSRISVVYCPRASAYFGHPHGGHSPHRYQEMLEAGIEVALGTDSVICLDTPDRISPLDEMRHLFRRDGAAPRTLLRMATTAGATALGADPDLFSFTAGRIAGILALHAPGESGRAPFEVALHRDDPPRWVVAASTVSRSPDHIAR